MNKPVTFSITITTLTVILLMIFSATSGCNGKDTTIPPGPDPDDGLPKAQVWVTSGDKSRLLSHQTDLSVKPVPPANWPVVKMDTSILFQEVDGYGAALTGSSAYLINKKMDATTRQALLKDLFDADAGIGISYLRLTMGASDFSLSDFTYNDLAQGSTDFELTQFSLAQDRDDVVPVLKEITALAPDIGLMGTPWSPPAWMKTNESLKGGQLKPECYEVYAAYFVKYIQAMQTEGIQIDAVTPQNEPLYFSAAYPCMEMQASEQQAFIKTSLGPAFAAAGIETKIILYDHNWDVTDYAISILNDPEVSQFIDGTAFHAYAGNVSAMSTVKNAYPDKNVYFTEISGGDWATNFADNLMWNMSNIFIGTARNWSKTALLWNLVLDQNHGPKNNGCQDCRGVVTLNTNSGKLTYNEEFYSIGHFSKFVRPGAKRVGVQMPQSLPNAEAVGFINVNGSKVLIFCNYCLDLKTFTITQHKKNITYSIPGVSVATLVWD